MRDLWSSPLSATVRCPQTADAQLRIIIVAPAPDGLLKYDPPTTVPRGFIFECLNAAGGTGQVTIEGFAAQGAAIAGRDLPLTVSIKVPGLSALVDAAAQEPLEGAWQKFTLNVGIDNRRVPYGSIYLSREQNPGHGESMQCTLLDFLFSSL